MSTPQRIEFFVPGDPKAQKRHRTYARGKGGKPLPFSRQVDPSANDKASFIAQVRQHKPKTPWLTPLELRLTFLLPRTKGHYRTGKRAHEIRPSAPNEPTGKPDIDNLAKLVMDAMTGVFYRDDTQIVYAVLRKLYCTQCPGTRVILKEMLP